MANLLIIGGGGHGKVVADSAAIAGRWNYIAFLDDLYPGLQSVYDWPVIGKIEKLASARSQFADLLVAIGNADLRLALLGKATEMGYVHPALFHRTCFVSSLARVAGGSIVLAQAAVQAGAELEQGCIINTGASVDHDCKLAAGVHVAPGARLGGGVSVGYGAWIGIGASVKEGVSIGDKVTVGANAAVIEDVPSGVTVVGVPARIIDRL